MSADSLVPGSFDSLMAKLIVTGRTRAQALQRARRALTECHIEGVASVLPFHRALLDEGDFTNAEALCVHTRWIETEFAPRVAMAPRPDPASAPAWQHTWIEIDGQRRRLGLPAQWLGALSAPGAWGAPGDAEAASAAPPAPAAQADANAITAPLTGSLLAWKAEPGQAVEAGQTVAVMEAMKMEVAIPAPRAGRLHPLVEAGSALHAGDALARLED